MSELSYKQGAWTAIHVNTFKKLQATEQGRSMSICSGCHHPSYNLKFVKMDNSWYGVACCPECYPYATSHVGILKLEYPPKKKKDKVDHRQYKLPL